MPMTGSDFVAIEDLAAGDVLLSRGSGDMSRWMAWNGESPYSHAAIVIGGRRDDPQCVEAVAPQARRRSVLHHIAAPCDVLDVYRPCRKEGGALDMGDRERIARIASTYVGRPFATRRMLPLALRTLMRHKLRIPVTMRGPSSGADITCVELVYRVLDDAVGILPAPSRKRARMPRPRLRPRKLLDEYRAYRGAAKTSDKWSGKCDAHTGIDDPHKPIANRYPDIVPGDLTGSPSLRYIGRLR